MVRGIKSLIELRPACLACNVTRFFRHTSSHVHVDDVRSLKSRSVRLASVRDEIVGASLPFLSALCQLGPILSSKKNLTQCSKLLQARYSITASQVRKCPRAYFTLAA